MTAAPAIHAAIGGVLRTRLPELSADDVDDIAGSITDSIMALAPDESPFGEVAVRNVHVHIPDGVTPADVARETAKRLAAATGPSNTSIKLEAPRSGQVTERDRFLDEANDRRCAMQAAARIATTGNINAVASDYRSILGILRQGKDES